MIRKTKVADRLNQAACIKSALRKFGKEVAGCRGDDGALPWPPMLPYVYPMYGKSSPRMFYIGQDTYGWMPCSTDGNFSEFLDLYETGHLTKYLHGNSTKALTLQDRIDKKKFRAGSFWYAVNQLHLKICTGKVADLSDLTESQLSILNGIGYGNLNAVEVEKSLQNEGLWSDINDEQYWKIRDAADVHLNRYKILAEAFKPNCAVVLSWSGKANEDDYFSGTDFEQLEWRKQKGVEFKVFRVVFKGSVSHVIWTCHPTSLKYQGVSWKDFVHVIAAAVHRTQAAEN